VATSVKLDDDLAIRVRRLAELRRRSPHWIMREAIREYIAREEARESFRQQALSSWSAYQETGRHMSGDELRAWLSTWGTDAEVEPPECHE
jgi:predicted transcriptional regulator